MPGRFELKPTLEKVWHAPDNFRFMDPLPPMHRRGIIIAAIVLVVGFLLPSDDTPNAPVVTREAQLDIQSQSQPPTEEQLRAQLVTPQNDPDQVAPVAPEPIQEGQPEEQPQTTQTQPFQPDSGIDNQWRSYRVLGVLGVFGVGWMVKIRQNASGVVTGLTIDTGNNQQVLFTRQPDGSFIRAR